MNKHEWLEEAVNRIDKLPHGKVFEIKELFNGIEWNELNAKEKQGFGRFFSSAYNDEKINNIERVNNHNKGANRYKKL